MNKFLCVFLFAALLLAGAKTASGSERRGSFRVGPALAYSGNLYRAGMPNPHDQPEFQHFHEPFGGGWAHGASAGLTAEYKFPKPGSGLIFQLTADGYASARLKGLEESAATFGADGGSRTSPTRFEAAYQATLLHLHIGYSLKLFNSGLHIVHGPGLGIFLSESLQRSQRILPDDGTEFRLAPHEVDRGWKLSPDRRSIIFPEDAPTIVHLGIQIGARYEIPLDPDVLLVPSLGSNIGLTKTTAGLRFVTFRAGLDLMFTL